MSQLQTPTRGNPLKVFRTRPRTCWPSSSIPTSIWRIQQLQSHCKLCLPQLFKAKIKKWLVMQCKDCSVADEVCCCCKSLSEDVESCMNESSDWWGQQPRETSHYLDSLQRQQQQVISYREALLDFVIEDDESQSLTLSWEEACGEDLKCRC